MTMMTGHVQPQASNPLKLQSVVHTFQSYTVVNSELSQYVYHCDFSKWYMVAQHFCKLYWDIQLESTSNSCQQPDTVGLNFTRTGSKREPVLNKKKEGHMACEPDMWNYQWANRQRTSNSGTALRCSAPKDECNPPPPTLALLVLFNWARNIQILGAQGATGSHSNHMRRITTCEAPEQSVQGAEAILGNSTQSSDLHWMCLGASSHHVAFRSVCLGSKVATLGIL